MTHPDPHCGMCAGLGRFRIDNEGTMTDCGCLTSDTVHVCVRYPIPADFTLAGRQTLHAAVYDRMLSAATEWLSHVTEVDVE